MTLRSITHGLVAASVLAIVGVVIQTTALGQPQSAPAQPAAQPGQATPAAKPARAPTLIALAFHADWCAKCKAMMPAATDAQKQAASKSVLFVKLDQTDKDSHQAEYLLAALGLGDLWKENAGKTGFVVLADPKSRTVVGRLTSDMDAAAMGQALDQAFAACEHPR